MEKIFALIWMAFLSTSLQAQEMYFLSGSAIQYNIIDEDLRRTFYKGARLSFGSETSIKSIFKELTFEHFEIDMTDKPLMHPPE